MSKNENLFHIRGYHRSNKAWYSTIVNERTVLFGMYHPDGDTAGEMKMSWEMINNTWCAKLECYYDLWSLLSNCFFDVIQKLGKLNDRNITEDQFCEILDSLGFKDLTEYTRIK